MTSLAWRRSSPQRKAAAMTFATVNLSGGSLID
jgi:hypothetical protein